MNVSIPAEAPKPRSRSLAARNAWACCALLPGLALLAWRDQGEVARHLLLALIAALSFEAIALRLRGQDAARFLAEGSAVLFAFVVVLYQPALGGWRLLLCLFVALVAGRQAFGGLGRNLFHPAAIALACASVLGVGSAPAAPDPLLATAWLAGGALACTLGIARWQAPAGLLLGGALGLVLANMPLATLADPRWLLAACFIAADPVTSAEDAKLRFASATLAGLAAAMAGPAAPAALPFALLALNALRPALDALPLRRERTQ